MFKTKTRSLLGLLLCTSQAGCITDAVPADIYASGGSKDGLGTSCDTSPSTAGPEDSDDEQSPPTDMAGMQEMDDDSRPVVRRIPSAI